MVFKKRRPYCPAAPDRDVPGQELTQKSLPEIGELFGGRYHTTVLHAVPR